MTSSGCGGMEGDTSGCAVVGSLAITFVRIHVRVRIAVRDRGRLGTMVRVKPGSGSQFIIRVTVTVMDALDDKTLVPSAMPASSSCSSRSSRAFESGMGDDISFF